MLKKLITISITAIASLQAATTYDKSLTDGNDNLNYWSDTTDSNLNNHSLSGATEVFTIGSRKNIPNVPTPIKVSTNKLCSDDRKGLVSCSKSDSLEPRYTDDGLTTSGEINLRTWYKATTPKSVNGVVDDPCPSLSNVGSVINWWANFPSLRCERTIATYTPKVNSIIYTSKVGSTTSTSSVVYANKIANTTTSGGTTVYAAKIATTTSGGTTVYANKISGSSSYAATATSSGGWKVLSGYGFFTCSGYRGAGFMIPNTCSTGSTNGGSYSLYVLYNQTNGCSTKYYAWTSVQTITNYSVGQTLGMYTSATDFEGNGSMTQSHYVTLQCTATSSSYSCPSGGTLSGSTCTTTTSTCPSGYVDNGSNCSKTTTGTTTTYTCPSGYVDNGSNCKKTISGTTTTTYSCPATYTDNGTNCKKTVTGSTTTYSCPSGYSDNGSNCQQTIQVCPDASWSDNVTNCKKNVPEYKLFSTF